MRKISTLIALGAFASVAALLPGCIAPLRVCTSCTYKPVSFTGVPSGNIETATLGVSVKHVGACPQKSFPTDCTETLSYSVKCAVGSGSAVTLPMLIDAAATNPNRSAKLTVKTVGGTSVTLTGVVGSGSGSPNLPTTPCAPPTVDPYVTLPNVN